MAKYQFEAFMSKYMFDPAFRTVADADLKQAMLSLGITITTQVGAALDVFQKSNKLDDLKKLANVVDNDFVGME
jgi:hypothetical protein